MKNDNEDELLDVAENLINKLHSITGGKSNEKVQNHTCFR